MTYLLSGWPNDALPIDEKSFIDTVINQVGELQIDQFCYFVEWDELDWNVRNDVHNIELSTLANSLFYCANLLCYKWLTFVHII